MTTDAHCTITEDDGIITVTATRPKKLNAISPEITEAYWTAANALADRDDLRVMVITATGSDYFTAGLDLSVRGGNRHGNPATQHQHPGWNFRRNYRSHHLLYDEFEAIEKPIIMAIDGICLGAGVEMAASCDFRLCTPDSQFRVPEVQLGAIAGSGGTSRLTRLVGPAWGKWMAMAAMPVGAELAKSIGLVQEIYPAETFMDDVYAFCRHLMTIQAEALGLAKLTVDLYTDVQDRTVQRQIDRLAVWSTFGEFEKSMEKFGLDTSDTKPED